MAKALPPPGLHVSVYLAMVGSPGYNAKYEALIQHIKDDAALETGRICDMGQRFADAYYDDNWMAANADKPAPAWMPEQIDIETGALYMQLISQKVPQAEIEQAMFQYGCLCLDENMQVGHLCSKGVDPKDPQVTGLIDKMLGFKVLLLQALLDSSKAIALSELKAADSRHGIPLKNLLTQSGSGDKHDLAKRLLTLKRDFDQEWKEQHGKD
jgi:hypothetical protein